MQAWMIMLLLGASAASFIIGCWMTTVLAVRRIEHIAKASMPQQNLNVWQRSGPPVMKARRSVVHETEKMFIPSSDVL
jgi:hypothetical protein